MRPIKLGHYGKNFVVFTIFVLFLLYLSLAFFKTGVSFSDSEIAFSSNGAPLACGADCMKVAHGFLYYGVFDLMRTASVSLLIGLMVPASLLGEVPGPRRAFAVAMLICGPFVVISAVLGEVQFLVRLLLISMGVFGTLDGWWTLLRTFMRKPSAS